MSDPSGRVKHIAAGNMMLPACCAMCGNVGNEDGYADPGIFIEWHGNIYFCPSCSFEIAALFGAVEGHRYAEVDAKLTDALILLVEQQAEIARLENNVDAYRNLFSPPDLSGNSIFPDGNVPDSAAEYVASEPAEDLARVIGEAEAEPAQSVKSKRSANADEPTGSDFAASLGL